MRSICNVVRKTISVPILNAGNHTPETAVELIESGDADFVMMGRPLIADPHIVNKLIENRRDEIRPCIRCNEDCIGRIITRLTKISCSVNPVACFEKRIEMKKTENPKKVVVIGGGPGGMEAARTAALKGHRVSLYEKDKALGGQLKSAATPDFKSQLRELVEWYKRQLELLNIEVHLNSEINEDNPVLKDADYIIVATGAVPIMPEISGIENAVDIISAHIYPEKLKGDRIVYCGGGLSACDSALETAQKGKKTVIIEMLEHIAANDHFINRAALFPLLSKYGVEIYTNHTVSEIKKDGVKAINIDGKEVFITADTVVSSFGMKPYNETAKKIDEKYHLKTRIIGDCEKIRKVGGAVREGFYAALTLD